MVFYKNMKFDLLDNTYITIRKANITDIDKIYMIESVSFGQHHWSKEAFKKELTNLNSNYLVCEHEKDITFLGYAGYWKVGEEGHITTLAVSPLYRRKHVADILLYTLIYSAIQNNIKWLTLEVRSSNIPALSLYKKFGFKEIGIRKKYYQDNNEDGLILWTENITNDSYRSHIDRIISSFLCVSLHADKLQ